MSIRKSQHVWPKCWSLIRTNASAIEGLGAKSKQARAEKRRSQAEVIILKKIWILSAAILCTAGYAEERPNFVIVLADDVSWSSFGCVEGGLYTRTPHIDELAVQGVRFTNFSGSVAQCGPLRHELYTGLLPPTSGVYSNGSKPKGCLLYTSPSPRDS